MTHQSSTEHDLTGDQNSYQQDQNRDPERPITPRHHDPRGRRDAAADAPPPRGADGPIAVAAGRTVTVAEQPVRVHVEPVEMADLGRDDWFIGPDGALYEVARPAAEHPSGWTDVTNLSMSSDEEQTARQRGDAEPGTSPRDGFFSYPNPVTIDRVVALAPADEQGLVGEEQAAALGALTERWAGAESDLDAAVRRAAASVDRLHSAAGRREHEQACVRDTAPDVRDTGVGRER